MQLKILLKVFWIRIRRKFFIIIRSFKMLLAIYKEVIVSLYIKGYYSKFIISTNFLIIRAVYIAVSGKTLYPFTS